MTHRFSKSGLDSGAKSSPDDTASTALLAVGSDSRTEDPRSAAAASETVVRWQKMPFICHIFRFRWVSKNPLELISSPPLMSGSPGKGDSS